MSYITRDRNAIIKLVRSFPFVRKRTRFNTTKFNLTLLELITGKPLTASKKKHIKCALCCSDQKGKSKLPSTMEDDGYTLTLELGEEFRTLSTLPNSKKHKHK
ncbi:hypothetical protein TcasGA2_TC016260 [Tribolium castaneum]|uniref:Uncharacterized protein n=1 Tax=Tribolium castaneum TaxID=7070 RepID=D6X2X8_TRICA|nr:hypothetical protein TcasGA2_TC016260 [Tribolium castaneum]